MRSQITVRKRLPVDTFIWNIFVEACGSRCSACGGEKGKLERGHRIPHAIGGVESWDNLTPVCRSCNNKNKKRETPVTFRPADYLERFYILLGERLRPQISCSTVNGRGYLIHSKEPAEKKQVIGWKKAENGLPDSLLTRSSDTTTRPEAERIVERLITVARSKSPRPNLPFPSAKTDLLQLAMKHGRQQFDLAAEGFLADEAWRLPGKDLEVMHDSWLPLTGNFEHFVGIGGKHRVALEQRKRREAEESQRQRVLNRASRWEAFLLAAKCTDWPGMTDEDRTFIAAVRSETELRDVSEDELDRAQHVRATEFRAKKKVVEDFITVCDRMIAIVGQYDTESFREFLKDVRSVDHLQRLHRGVQQLYDILQGELSPRTDGDPF
jgi:hypothetical protein